MTPTSTSKTLRLCRWALLAGSTLAALAQNTPSINKISDINVGSVVAGASSGTVVLNSPSGTRTTTGGTSLGATAGTTLGSLTLSGKKNDGWSIRNGGAIPFTLTGSNGGTLTVTAVDFEPSTTNTGTFPDSNTYYLGVTVSVGSTGATPAGTYSGNCTLRLTDTKTNQTSTTTFAVMAKVDPVITLTKVTDLRFGEIIKGATAGTVIISPAGASSATGGVSLAPGSPSGAATFTVTGAPNTTYAITLPATITLSMAGSTLTVSSLTSTPSTTGTLSGGGTQTLSVGGTLNVTANQTDGNYAGSFNLTVAYN